MHVIAGVEHDQDVGVTVVVHAPPCAAGRPGRAAGRRSPPSGRRPGPGGPHRAARSSDVRPGSSAATNEYGQPRDELGLAPAAAMDVAEQPLRAGRGVRDAATGRHRRPARSARRRPAAAAARQRPAQPPDLDPPVVEPVIHRAVPAAVLGHQRQIHQRAHRAISAQHRIGQLEQRIRPRGATTGRTPPGTRQDHPAGPGCHRAPRPRHAATLTIAATAFVFELCGRNPKRIKRWPFHVLPTRRTRCTSSPTPTSAG